MEELSFYGLDLDAHDPGEVARFWAGVLGWRADGLAEGRIVLSADDDAAYRLLIRESDAPKLGQNRIHFDLTSSTAEAMKETIARALALGGRRIDIGQTAQDAHEVIADPEGNEFCVIEPGNDFLADTGVIGAINCDGTQAVGYFWSDALGWPVVWDENEETAIQAPTGGPKITWSGPPLMQRQGRDRLRFVLSVVDGDGVHAALSRLAELGATLTDASPAGAGRVEASMTDPDGNTFRIVAGREG